MSTSNKDIALSIIHFLKKSVSNNAIAEDYAESMDVAIDCIADAFEVNKDDDSKIVESKFNGKSLGELVQSALSASSASESAASTSSASTAAPSAEDQAAADKLKAEGNKAMAVKDFQEAIAKYTAAIKLNPTNVVYLSNRAAAYSQAADYEKAIKDAEDAIKLDSKFSKAYSRLGLARYANGDAKGAMEAYKQGLEVEGDTKSEAMSKGFETARRRVEEDLEKSIPSDSVQTREAPAADAGAGAGAGAGGMPDFSSMFGGSGGMPNLSEMMNNPQIMKAAQDLMSNPGALQGLMNNPQVRNMAQNMGLGGENGPDLSELMNNPMLKSMANQFMGGGAGGAGGAGNGDSSA
ncbi:small glutamine-rich tetratricopeptide repeat-containing protein 2 [[Candida] anglica]|uniref:Small glutamine-rich tetratricopeptide repeat-containing protein 2 n=1 Tax=[Candida] anglica TaxID=148631 RepID=A0ABP0EB43_9ASCO